MTGSVNAAARRPDVTKVRNGPGATSADACRLFDPLRRRMSAPSPSPTFGQHAAGPISSLLQGSDAVFIVKTPILSCSGSRGQEVKLA